MSKAWLHMKDSRAGFRVWEFDQFNGECSLKHKTSRGNTYIIMHDTGYTKPFWIGKLIPNSLCWVTVENQLRATSIEFENGAEYIFPGRR